MSLADFWDNITTPGFLSASFDELKEMCSEFKEEMRGHIEEGEELFTDGFYEIVIKDNNDYRTSTNKREDGEKEIKVLRKELLEARGNTENNRPFINVICHEFSSLVHAIRDCKNSDIEFLYNELRNEFSHITFIMPDELLDFIKKVSWLFEVPEAPLYEAPPSGEKEKKIGPVKMSLSDKQKRVVSADKYLEQVEKYKEIMELEIVKQNKIGLFIDSSTISDVGKELIEDLGALYWKLNEKDEILKPFNEKLSDVLTSKEKLKYLLILTAAIYSISKFLIVEVKGNSFFKESLIDDLTKIEEQLNAYIGVDDGVFAEQDSYDPIDGDSTC